MNLPTWRNAERLGGAYAQRVAVQIAAMFLLQWGVC